MSKFLKRYFLNFPKKLRLKFLFDDFLLSGQFCRIDVRPHLLWCCDIRFPHGTP